MCSISDKICLWFCLSIKNMDRDKQATQTHSVWHSCINRSRSVWCIQWYIGCVNRIGCVFLSNFAFVTILAFVVVHFFSSLSFGSYQPMCSFVKITTFSPTIKLNKNVPHNTNLLRRLNVMRLSLEPSSPLQEVKASKITINKSKSSKSNNTQHVQEIDWIDASKQMCAHEY